MKFDKSNIKEHLTSYEKVISNGDYKFAQSTPFDLQKFSIPHTDLYLMDLSKLQQDKAGFSKRMDNLVRNSKFNWGDLKTNTKEFQC